MDRGPAELQLDEFIEVEGDTVKFEIMNCVLAFMWYVLHQLGKALACKTERIGHGWSLWDKVGGQVAFIP